MHFGDRPELPSSIDAEQAILGSLLMWPDLFDSVAHRLEARHFYEEIHQGIFEAFERMVKQGKTPNPILIRGYLPDVAIGNMGVGEYLAKLVAQCAMPAAEIPGMVERVRSMACAREAADISDQLGAAAYGFKEELSFSDQVDTLRSRLDDILTELHGKQEEDGSGAAESYLTAISGAASTRTGVGVPICLPELQTVLSEAEFQEGRLYGMLSSSGEGKTSLTLQIIYKAVEDGHPVLFLSYDQSKRECTAQMVAQNLGIEMRRQFSNKLSQDEIEKAYAFAQKLWAKPFDVIDCTNENAAKLSSYARRFLKQRANGKTPLIVIDHIGTIKPDDPRADEGTKARTIAQQLKSLAKETHSAVLVLQQRSSAGMKRPNPRPIGADLYGGEAAKQPFDAIFYLYRAEEHMRRQIETATDGQDEDKIRARFRQAFGGQVEGRAELGTLKARFADPSIKRQVEFEARCTRYKTLRQTDEGLPL